MKIKLTRRNQLWFLIFLSAFTAAAQYVIQGVESTGGDPRGFPWYFWVIDYSFWALRALVESWVVIYLFTTSAKGILRNVILTGLEIALLALITFTIGPALQAVGRGVPVYELLQENYGKWQYAIGAYTGLMMAGTGFAYKFQPHDMPDLEEKYAEALAELEHLKAAVPCPECAQLVHPDQLARHLVVLHTSDLLEALRLLRRHGLEATESEVLAWLPK